MNLTIELPDDIGAALEAQAREKGISPDSYVSRVLQQTLTPSLPASQLGPPFDTGYGMWAEYGPAPSAEELDENRREMFRNFAETL